MGGMIKSLRSGADRAAFEAGKRVRLQRTQNALRSQEQQRHENLVLLGETVWRHYVQGRVSEPELVSLCHAVQTATHQIAELEQEVAKLREEQPARPSKCLDCGHDVGPEDSFCPFCGARARASSSPLAQPTPIPMCPDCHRPVRPGAVYCSHCGRRQAPSA